MTSDDDGSRSGAALHVRPASQQDWRALVSTRGNVLAHGDPLALDAFLKAVRPGLREPVSVIACGPTLALRTAPSIVLTDIDRLEPQAQQTLLAWANDERHVDTQIVSMTSTSLFSLVEGGAFDRELYYTLNTIYLQLELA
jgi:sigma-54-interacting transcriptional regulator